MHIILLSGQGPSNQFFSRFAGPHRLATELRQSGFSTQIIMGLGYYSSDDLIKLLEKYVDSETLFIGISSTFFVEYSQRYANFYSNLYSGNKILMELPGLLAQIKDRFPNVKIVVGGPSARTKVRDLSNVDLIIEGYGEAAVVEYAHNLLKRKSIFYSTYHKKIPIVTNATNEGFDFHNSKIIFDKSDRIFLNEALPLELSRGCIFRCKFCSFPLRGKSINDTSFIKNMDNVYTELMYNYDNWGTTNYIIVDDTFNDSQDKLLALSKVFEKLPFKIQFSCYIRADLLYAYPESLELLKNMGIRGAFLGIESFNTNARKMSAKGFRVDKLLATIETLNSRWRDVVITSSFIYGLPGESLSTVTDWTENIILKSGLFDTHDLIIQPLYIQREKTSFSSDFDLEMQKYGYEFTNDERVWRNDQTTWREMSEYSIHVMREASKRFRPFSSFHIMTLLGYGLPLEKVLSLDAHKHADIDFVENTTISKYAEYYRCMMEN